MKKRPSSPILSYTIVHSYRYHASSFIIVLFQASSILSRAFYLVTEVRKNRRIAGIFQVYLSPLSHHVDSVEKSRILNIFAARTAFNSIYSWTSPMMKFVMDETRSVQSVTNFTLEESMNIFIMQLNIALKDFYTFFLKSSFNLYSFSDYKVPRSLN